MKNSAARLRLDAAAIFRAAILAVDPTELVGRYLSEHAADMLNQPAARSGAPTLVVGAGKAAARMAAGCERIWGVHGVGGEVIVADGCGLRLHYVTVTEAGHPLPDARGEEATRSLVRRISEQRQGDIVCLISGGASSLLVCPRPPVTLKDKIDATRLLLECGVDIRAFNTVRKHLSVVKGGGLLRHLRTRMLGLLISDVIGDDPDTIGSGPTAPDDTTYADAWAVLERYELTERVPAAVRQLLRDGVEGRLSDTVKPDSPEIQRCRNVIVGSNRTALDGAAHAARSEGWTVHVEERPISGDSTVAARDFAARIQQLASSRRAGAPLCILAGGETTVHVTGKGRGGRNQEFALALASALAGQAITVLSAGTDGIDGPTDAAGAFVDGTTLDRARKRGLDAQAALRANDSYTFFSQLGDLFCCGPTGTNVMDVKIALLPGPSQHSF